MFVLPDSYRIRFHDVRSGSEAISPPSAPTVQHEGSAIIGKTEFVCHYGPGQHKGAKEKKRMENAEMRHTTN